jgi:DNA-binding CsgD family transcriptional regulator/tetratricopeptide (TPR) repeat protein
MQSAARPEPPRTADHTVYSRDAELAAVRGLLADPAAGAKALVLIGEAGIGKTTLWSAGVEAARSAGWTVLTARGAPEESGLSFAGLMDLMESLPDSTLASLPQIQRAAVEAALLRAAPTTAVGPLEVGAGTLAVLRKLCQEGPVLVAVDDLQWLDEPTTDALWFAVRRLGSAALRILTAYRTAGVADDESYVRKYVAADDIPLETVERLTVGPLDSEPIRQLITDRFQTVLPSGAADRIAEQTGGNPFWALEVGAALAAEPGPGRARAVAASELPIPASLSALVRRRLGNLEPAVHEVLLTVAMLDKPTIALTRRVLAPAVADPDAAIDRAVAVGVVAAQSGRLRVAHPLLSAAVVDATPPLARGALHRRLAAVVEDPELRARHVLRAWQGEPDAEIAAYLEAGSASAAARGAVRSAAELAERAADCTPAAARDDCCRRLHTAAELHLRVGDYHQARICAEAVWRTGVEDRRRALPVLVEATWWADGRHKAEGFVAPLAANTELDPHTRAVVLALAADVGDGQGTPRAELARRSLELFDQVGDEADGAALATALLYSALADLEAGRGIAFDRMHRIGELQRELPYVVSSNRADNVIASWYKDVDDLDRSRVALHTAIAANQDLGDEPMLASLYGHLALTEIWAGRPAAARDALRRGTPLISADAGKPVGLAAAEATLTLLSDSIGITRPHIEKLPGGGIMVASLTGLAALLDGDDEAAAEILGTSLAKARAAGVHEPGRRGRFEGNLGQALANLGRLDEARDLATELTALGTANNRPTLLGVGLRLEGLALSAEGELEAAAHTLQEAVTAHRTSQFPLELGRSLLALGQIQRRRKIGPQAGEALRAALDCFEAAGAVPFADLVRAELGKGRRGTGGESLTPTEQQVADLVAAGSTNREVAARLFISIRTVETHLASVYRKLGVRSRSELAARHR